jgi:hypothetical protein
MLVDARCNKDEIRSQFETLFLASSALMKMEMVSVLSGLCNAPNPTIAPLPRGTFVRREDKIHASRAHECAVPTLTINHTSSQS